MKTEVVTVYLGVEISSYESVSSRRGSETRGWENISETPRLAWLFFPTKFLRLFFRRQPRSGGEMLVITRDFCWVFVACAQQEVPAENETR